VFKRFSAVWELRVGGQLILTTGEHPFFRDGQWVAAQELQVGDKLLCQDGSTITVEGLRETGNWVPVYNLRVADWHTYFVGDDSWGFGLWAHNVCAISIGKDHITYRTRDEAFAAAREILGISRSEQPTRLFQFVPPTSNLPRSELVVTETNTTHQGRWYEYCHNGRWLYIVEHDNDHSFGCLGHFHMAVSKSGDTVRMQPGDTYRNLGKPGSSAHICYNAI